MTNCRVCHQGQIVIKIVNVITQDVAQLTRSWQASKERASWFLPSHGLDGFTDAARSLFTECTPSSDRSYQPITHQASKA